MNVKVCWEQLNRCDTSSTSCCCNGRLFSKSNNINNLQPPTYSPIMSFFALPRNGDLGSVVFSDIIEILESDDRVTTRHMNHDGSFYHTEEAAYDDDSNSFDLGSIDENRMSFLDALEDEIEFDDMIGDNTNQFHRSNRSVETFE